MTGDHKLCYMYHSARSSRRYFSCFDSLFQQQRPKQSGPFEAQVDLGLPICLDEPKSFSFLSLIQDFLGEYKSENLKTIEIF